MLKKNWIITFTVIGVSAAIQTFPMLYKEMSTMNEVKKSYQKENNKKEELTIPYAYKTNDYKSLFLALEKVENKSAKKTENKIEEKKEDILEVEKEDTSLKENPVSEERETNKNISTNNVSVVEKEKNNENVSEKANNSTQIETEESAKNEEINTVPIQKEVPAIYYDRITSIYENDNITLIRREYYVNNKLTYYSVVKQFNAETNSYVEQIYKYNYETNREILIRTDVYTNGNLVSSY